ncbi:MAG: acyl-CoA dehydrogenase family protein, partial [Pseudomonadales bacterium]|nr:acyl-CoA dehydrogenase family protein [Pseudomonadales bacterium]
MTSPENPTQARSSASAIAPYTDNANFYRDDKALGQLLRLYAPPGLLAHVEPWLERLGALAAGELDRCAALADKHPPVLHHRNRFGDDVQWIEYHPAYRRLEEAAFGEFEIHAMSHRGTLGWNEPFPAVVKHAFTYLFNQAEFGLGCPINVTDSGAHILRLFGEKSLVDKYLPDMITSDMSRLTQGGQFMTEKEGGSDVGSLTTEARFDGENWRAYGEKWFCSNADAKVVVMLARPTGAPDGTRGLGLFLMPRFLDDGTPNHYRLVRLKDKLGTRSMASGEAKLEGAIVYPVGPVDRGIVQMMEMVNWSRLSNGVKSSALMMRSVHDARAVMFGRQVFGTPLWQKPLARRQMLKIQLPAEQSLSMWMFTAEALDRTEGYGGQPKSQEAAAVLRLATPVLKYRATRDSRMVAGDAMDMRGGIGYVEDWINPRLLRDAHLGSIWEGTGNIIAIDAMGRAVKRHDCHEAFAAALHDLLSAATNAPPAFVERIGGYLDKAVTAADRAAGEAGDEAEGEIMWRQATSG